MLRKKDKKLRRFKKRAQTVTPKRKRTISFQVAGSSALKYNKQGKFTREVRDFLGKAALNALFPKELQQNGSYPVASVFSDEKQRIVVLRIQQTKREELLIQQENGAVEFVPVPRFGFNFA